MCMLAIDIQTAGWILMKFSIPRRLEDSWGCYNPVPPTSGYRVRKEGMGVSGATAVGFGKNFIKQKLQGVPDLVWMGHLFGAQIRIWKDLSPMSFWRHGHSL